MCACIINSLQPVGMGSADVVQGGRHLKFCTDPLYFSTSCFFLYAKTWPSEAVQDQDKHRFLLLYKQLKLISGILQAQRPRMLLASLVQRIKTSEQSKIYK